MIDEKIKPLLQKAIAESGLTIENPTVRRSSSRFCFGVEHGDYNGMELFGVGTNRFIWLAYQPNKTKRIRIYSANFPEEGLVDFPLGEESTAADNPGKWERFPRGVESILRREGYAIDEGFDAVIYSNIPGGGMSRSASLCLNLLLTLFEVNNIEDDGSMRVVDLAQMVENDYIGSPCGKLDQIMIYYARQGMGTHFQPTTGKISHIPYGGNNDDFRIVSLDTGTVRLGLEQSTYKIRHTECGETTTFLAEKMGITTLADINTPELYDKAVSFLEEANYHTVPLLSYLYSAQTRFHETLEAWRSGDIETVGANFRADGYGLRDDYKISGPELESMCDLARTVDGVLGERMLGGGDKGASGAIIYKNALDELTQTVKTQYPKSHPDFKDAFAIHACRSVDGIITFPLS